MRRKGVFTAVFVMVAFVLFAVMTFAATTTTAKTTDSSMITAGQIYQVAQPHQVAQQAITEGTVFLTATQPGMAKGSAALASRAYLPTDKEISYVIVSSFSGHLIGTAPRPYISATTPIVRSANYLVASTSAVVLKI